MSQSLPALLILSGCALVDGQPAPDPDEDPLAIAVRFGREDYDICPAFLLDKDTIDMQAPPYPTGGSEPDMHKWAEGVGAVEESSTDLRISVQGRVDSDVILQGMRLELVSSEIPDARARYTANAGCGGVVSPRFFSVQIDAPQPPTQAAFTALINRALFDAIKTAKFIRRNDPWRAKQLCDGDLKQLVLVMLEWHAVTHAHDRWYDGRFIDEWADREALAALPDTFAVYHAADLQRALFSTLDLFRRLAHEVADRLGYAYPADADEFVTGQIQLILRGNP
jgi:hypothetical protein